MKGFNISESLILMDINSVSDFLKVKPETIHGFTISKFQTEYTVKHPRFICKELMKWFLDGAKITKRRNNIC